MNHQTVREQLRSTGYSRVERDDRLLDILPNHTPEKGIELWERWQTDSVDLTRIHHAASRDHITHYSIPRQEIEKALTRNTKLDISQYTGK